MKKLIALTLVALFVSISTAYANGNPAQLFIGDPPKSMTYVYSGQLQPIYDTSFGVVLNGAGHPALDSLMLIVGIPNATVLPPSIIGTDPVSSTPVLAEYQGAYTSASPVGDVYEFLGLSGNNSNSFKNWYDADLALWEIDAQYFGIYTYQFSSGLIAGGETLDVTFDFMFPLGTFVVAYGEDGDSKAYSTPFTEAGMVVPEPGSLLLVGVGLLGLALFGKRRMNCES